MVEINMDWQFFVRGFGLNSVTQLFNAVGPEMGIFPQNLQRVHLKWVEEPKSNSIPFLLEIQENSFGNERIVRRLRGWLYQPPRW